MRLTSFLIHNAALATGFVLKQSTKTHPSFQQYYFRPYSHSSSVLQGWVQDNDGEWQWEEDDPNYTPSTTATTTASPVAAVATPQLPAGSFRPKKSLGQNYLKDPNTVVKIIKAFHQDATHQGQRSTVKRVVELGPGAGALTDRLVEIYGTDVVQCIEIDERSIDILHKKHPDLQVTHADILQVNYPQLADLEGQALVVIGNLPYYITSQILFALADASHSGAVDTATVTMQWEVGQRMVAPTSTKDYGILSVVFQLYADVKCHFKIPPTVFYPQPKVDSALIGVHFLGPNQLRQRLAGVQPAHLRRIVTTAFQQRRKTVRNSLKKLAQELEVTEVLNGPPRPLPMMVQKAMDEGDEFALQQPLPDNWASKRPEELKPGQFVELTRLFFGPTDEAVIAENAPLGQKVWRKMKHGKL
ncbi:small subunit methyltransferase A [Seminavis robusta]|uniref:rRNA adenine N(6)-methyltransferase n=1 Tax=Seminavis robusta TaxID=568900 RepID=A0A9N8EKL1_9STRA|nr:small subunit methyltransferase A [Seminavis robusta]|eukprot:Sro1303_g260960.1 small subunit methyltransferase A (416) ;mRNA; r:6702-8057